MGFGVTGLIWNARLAEPIAVPEQLSARYSRTVTDPGSGVVSGNVTELTYSVAAPDEL